MTWTKIFSVSALLFSISCAHRNIKDNNYWNGLTNKLENTDENFLAILEKDNQQLKEQIISDSKDSNLISLWGMSHNFDSNAKQVIVKDKIISGILLPFKIKSDPKIVHAGLIHTYGYLFSRIETPYGYKRDRWIDQTITNGFGLQELSLTPETLKGTLLTNVTYFAGMIVFKNREQVKILKASPEILNYNYHELKKWRIEERLNTLTLVTTLVEFPYHSNDSKNSYLLIYSQIDTNNQLERLITLFPIGIDTFQNLTQVHQFGTNQKINLRYNGYIENFPSNVYGTRVLIKGD